MKQLFPLCFSLPLGCLLASPALAQAPATFAPIATYSTGGNSRPGGVAVADVNADGRPDLLTANTTTNLLGVQLGTGAGTFGPLATYATGGSQLAALAVADVNADGRLDLLTANSGNTVSILPGTGTGTFGTAVVYSTGAFSQPVSIVVADINADTRPDLLVADYNNNAVDVLLGTGNGAFSPVSSYITGTNTRPLSLAVADVNLDGKLDVATANNLNGTVGVLLGTGTGTFGTATTYLIGLGSQPGSIAVADVNGDNQPDLLTTTYSGNYVGVLLSTGTGTFGAVATYSTGAGSQPVSLAVADVNGDGRRDLLTANQGTSTAGVLLGTGTGTFGAVATYSTGAGSQPVSLAVADVNADGRPDLLTANQGTNTAGVLLNTTTFLPTRTALPGAHATLAPNPARTSATLTATGLPAAATQLAATLTDALGRPVRRLTVPATAGAATGTVPTAGLAAGLYLLQLEALDAQGAALGTLPVQRLSVAD